MNPTASQRWTFLGVISAGLFLIGVDNSILYTALPVLREELQATELQGLWIINAYPLMLAGLLLGTGTLGDKIGHRLMFLIGLVIFGVASLTAAFSPTAWVLVAARAFLGIGAAAMMPATLALIRITFEDERERNIAIGVWGSVALAGAATGPVLGGALLEFFWWGSVFLINVPVVLIALVLTLLVAPPNMPNPDKHWDAISSVYALLALTGLVMAIKEAVSPARQLWLLALAVVVAVAGAVLFQRRQASQPEPLLDFSLFRNRLFTGGVIAAGMSMFVVAGLEMTTTQRFQLSAGFTPLQAGLLMTALAAASIPMSVIGGANLHRWGFLPLISGGFISATVGIALIIWSLDVSLIPLIVGLVLVGLGSGATISVASTAIIGSAPVRKAGMAASIEEVSYEFGTLCSVAILGSLFPAFYALSAPAEVADSFATGVDHAVFGEAARAALDSAYVNVLFIALGVALVTTFITAWCFRGNPKRPG